MTLASHEDLDEAVNMAVENMVKYLVDFEKYELSDALTIVSMAGDARICQVVDPKKTARVEITKDVAECVRAPKFYDPGGWY